MTTQSPEMEFIRSGKIRDIYTYGEDCYLLRTSNRISAFDVVLEDTIPGKGRVLNELTEFWMKRFLLYIPNHLTHKVPPVLQPHEEHGQLVVVKKLKPLPLEAIVRGHIIGSGWKDYQETGMISGHKLPYHMKLADRLPTVIYTPSTKADIGDHDENITFQDTIDLVGEDLAKQVRDISTHLYIDAALYASHRGIIIADTKLEFGLDDNGVLHLIDEVLTPDSSRFWPKKQWKPGTNPPSYDKQIVRDYLSTLDWDKTSPSPKLPQHIIDTTVEKYQEIQTLLTS